MTTITLEMLADLSPNMRAALHRADSLSIRRKDTYWITLQGLASRGLVLRPQGQPDHKGDYPITTLGRAYQVALEQAHK